MRTIKFRGKDIETGEWVYGDLHIRSAFAHIHTDEGARYKIDTDSIGQFTSLYDKNGKEIYEGDILDFNGLKIEIRFVRGVFALLCDGNLDEELCGDCRTDLFAKVIGNIHDNPELLKGGDEWKG